VAHKGSTETIVLADYCALHYKSISLHSRIKMQQTAQQCNVNSTLIK